MASQVSNHLEPWQDLNGKIVLVTGASSGLGREFCLDLAKAGCRIVAAARRMDRLKSLCDQINQLTSSGSSTADLRAETTTVRAVAVELDVTADGRTIEASVRKAWDAFGHIDALINNAGIRGSISSSLDISEEEWNDTHKTNLTGSLLVSKYIGIRMRDAGQVGSIINISSISGLNRIQSRGAIAYSSSKAGMNSITKAMALELGMHKIRVNAIAPGLFRSQITEALLEKDWLKNVALRTMPLKTFGTTDPALTSLVRYLIHDSSAYVTGNTFIVDAGYTLPGIPLFSSL
uniref:3-oxoacyl-[acyl-carrier-protein] reductase n=1 Tax=Davidia involucrata TaxID=16924 RepID=A0A5B6ZB52_DAVIN